MAYTRLNIILKQYAALYSIYINIMDKKISKYLSLESLSINAWGQINNHRVLHFTH